MQEMFRTPKRAKTQFLSGDMIQVTPPSRLFKIKSPETSPVNDIQSNSPLSTLSPSETKRGRPRAEALNTLILQGSTSPSSIKCTYCSRVFPREKSLQAHLRTHTGEKPYACDFPRCTKKFAQSGQLKTHQRLHTGEKPFICAVPHCERRFTHANRHCPEHPKGQLKRFNTSSCISIENIDDEQYKKEIQIWMDTVKKREKTQSTCSTPKKSRSFEESWLYQNYDEQNENINTENLNYNSPKFKPNHNFNGSPYSNESIKDYTHNSLQLQTNYDFYNRTFKTEEKIRYVSEEIEVETSPVSRPTTELPKKRWLREATQQQQTWESDNTQDLASPINWGEDCNVVEENQKRPTVLVKIGGTEQKTPITTSDMEIAVALVELGQANKSNYSF